MSWLIKRKYSFNKYLDGNLEITNNISNAFEYKSREIAENIAVKVSKKLKDEFTIVEKI